MSSFQNNKMTSAERRAVIGLAGIYGSRMLGLFLILPVFAIFAETLEGATPWLAGLAVGIYGLTQALLQLPFGFLSDRIGRKPVIIGGLILFALGSVIAAMSTDIFWIIVGRAVQGSGAIAAAVMALASDLTREEQRTKSMALIGMSIGSAFLLAMIFGPMISSTIGVSGIFWLTALLALIGMFIILFVVPSPQTSRTRRDAVPLPQMVGQVLRNSDLLRLDVGIFSLHLVLTAVFLVIPLALRDAGLPLTEHTWVYLPVMIISILSMVPFIILSEKKRQLKPIFLGAITVLIGTHLVMAQLPPSENAWFITLIVFFTAFNLLEATLPSLVSKTSPADAKGTAMGVYSTSQFAGAFFGGLIGGWAHQQWGNAGVFEFAAVICLIWLVVASGMRKPRHTTSQVRTVQLASEAAASELAAQLEGVAGVEEAVVIYSDGVAYLNVDKQRLDSARLDAIVGATA